MHLSDRFSSLAVMTHVKKHLRKELPSNYEVVLPEQQGFDIYRTVVPCAVD